MSKPICRIDAEVLDNGDQKLFYAGDPMHFPGFRQLRRMLFAWHKPSYYGTFIDEWPANGQHGFILPARYTAGFWSEMPLLRHGTVIEWGSGAEELQQAGKLLTKALAEGWFVPALTAGRDNEGKPGWRLLRGNESHPELTFTVQCEQLGYEKLDGQLGAIIADLFTGEEEVAQAWKQVSAAYPASSYVQQTASRPMYVDEYEMWEEIGFRVLSLPFAIGLRLEEPSAQDGNWRLLPWVHQRGNPAMGHIYDWNGSSAAGQVGSPISAWPEQEVAEAIDRQRGRWLGWIEQLGELWNAERVWVFLEQESEGLLARGIHVLLPSWWEELRKTKPSMVASLRKESGASGLLGKDQLLAFDWMISVGGMHLDMESFRAAVKGNRKLLWHNGNWMLLHPRWVKLLQTFIQRMGKRDNLTLSEAVEAYLSGGHSFDLGDLQGKVDNAGEDFIESQLHWQVKLNAPVTEWLAGLEDKERRSGEIAISETLRPILRPYQAIGAGWLLSLRQIGFGACLADDMGLGKTIQFMAYIATLKEQGLLTTPGLLICPTSVLGNWEKELERFAPNLKVYLHYGPRRARGEEWESSLENKDLVITSYALANTDSEWLQTLRWSVIGLDEAQNIKNHQGKQSKAIRSLQAEHRVALTGTPVENRLSELWTIFDFINPAYLGTFSHFQKRFGFLDKGFEAADDKQRYEKGVNQLQRMIRPFLMRRLKNDPSIQLDLPEKNENRIYIPLTMEQGALYEAELQNMMDKIEQLDAMERRGIILATLGRLKQICNHPALYRKDIGASMDKSGVKRGARSHKLSRLSEMVEEMLGERRKGLIFTQFIGMGDILREELQEAHGCRVDFLHGGLSKEARDSMVRGFQEESNGTQILILSLKAGGTGLNLTAASHVFHYDRWWNPAVEDQATDRAYRIGQTRDVQVHKFVALGTLEERIDEMIGRKRTLGNQIVGSGEQWVTELSTNELREMFALRREWVRD
ncbi:DEAD/DEAH box helicase [Cohnella luojiensis]|uniref:DEAD/DEAH box helicase n=1 Tax=Cohnella luojiensis TaxID=652876 RepID=A0A4Y8LYM1_9BACL|nr:DEAD/DEAH box helicase [Cohnella luojiensis]TFE26669.1 DEAD/DEAH box helicase [Cohnella luojiensis]